MYLCTSKLHFDYWQSAFFSTYTFMLYPSHIHSLFSYLRCQVIVHLLLFGFQCIPPFTEYLADCPVVLVGVFLMYQCTVSFAEDHEGIHWPADVVLTLLQLNTATGEYESISELLHSLLMLNMFLALFLLQRKQSKLTILIFYYSFCFHFIRSSHFYTLVLVV